jgi:hypothetical protein
MLELEIKMHNGEHYNQQSSPNENQLKQVDMEGGEGLSRG